MESTLESFVAHDLVGLLQEGGALIVGDAIECRVSLFNALDLGANWVSCVQGVVANATELSCNEVVPWRSKILKILGLGNREIWNIGCKWLIKPQVVPPFHGHKVAKPMMSQLVEHCDERLLFLLQGRWLAYVEKVLINCDASDILHCATGKFRSKDLVIFWELVFFAKEIFIEDHTTLGHAHYFFKVSLIDLLHQWVSQVNLHWRQTLLIHGNVLEWPSYDCEQIGWYLGTLFKHSYGWRFHSGNNFSGTEHFGCFI